MITYDFLVSLFLKYGELTKATGASLSGKNKHKSHSPVSDVQEQKEWGWSDGPRRPHQAQWLRAAGWQGLLHIKHSPPKAALGGRDLLVSGNVRPESR